MGQNINLDVHDVALALAGHPVYVATCHQNYR